MKIMDPRNMKDEMNAENGLEQELDSIRARLSALGEQEPPALLDQAVLNTARRELAGRRRRQVRWIGAFATVSVLVLTLTLVVQQSEVPVAPATGKTNGIRLGPVTKREATQQDQMDTEGNADQVAGEPAAREEVRQLNAKAQRAALATSKTKSDFDLGDESPASPSPPSPAPMLPSSEDSGDAERIQPGSIQDTPATSVPTGEPVTEGKQQESMADQSRRSAEEQRVDVTDAVQGSEPDEQVIEARAKEYELNSNLEDPDDWIARLLELRQDRQFEQLQLELDAFQAAYPDYPLPPELAEFAR
jgi:hypothetical protein